MDNTINVDSHDGDNEGHVDKKWTMKELLPTQPSTFAEKKPRTVYKSEAVETLRLKILQAEKKIEKEKITWKKNILYRLKSVLITRLKNLEETSRDRGDVLTKKKWTERQGTRCRK